jgi:bifunctional non-homologous end joining protein LigD
VGSLWYSVLVTKQGDNLMSVQATSLFFKEGPSDKEYHVQIEKSGSGYVVNFQYGRRGSTLKPGTKTDSAVSLKEAEKIYTKLVNEKTGKGYVARGPAKSSFTPTVVAAVEEVIPQAEKSAIVVQLLNPVNDDAQVEALLKDNSVCVQQKMDGERRAVEKKDGSARGINRKGLYVQLPKEIADSIYEDGIFDGEIIGDKLYLFDVLELDGENLQHKSFLERFALLQSLDFGSAVEVVPVAETEEAKREVLEKVQAAGGEGIVFKKKNAKYSSGRPASGGDQLKYKLYKTATFVVGSQTKAKRSVGLIMFDGLNEVEVGKVTIPSNHEVPKVGEVVEVRYLYANRDGAVYQPVYLGPRTDLEASEAVIEQLEYKNEAA